MIPRNEIILGDATAVLRSLPSDSFETVITSTPYFMLRNYQVDGQIGLEATLEEFVSQIEAVGEEVGRVLTPTGSFWLNIGDSYSRHQRYGAVAKSMLLVPERVLLALAGRGWTVRNKVVWSKPNPMPSSVKDRLSCTWEPLFHLVRSEHYHYDLDAIRVPHVSTRKALTARHGSAKSKVGAHEIRGSRPAWAGPLAGSNAGLARARAEGRPGHRLGKNPGDVWSIATAGFRGPHPAVFPPRLIERPIRATCPERVCLICTRPWHRTGNRLNPSCECDAGWRTGRVLDPFIGAGTTAIVAEKFGRQWLGIELNPHYRTLAKTRIAAARMRVATTAHVPPPQ